MDKDLIKKIIPKVDLLKKEFGNQDQSLLKINKELLKLYVLTVKEILYLYDPKINIEAQKTLITENFRQQLDNFLTKNPGNSAAKDIKEILNHPETPANEKNFSNKPR